MRTRMLSSFPTLPTLANYYLIHFNQFLFSFFLRFVKLALSLCGNVVSMQNIDILLEYRYVIMELWWW